MSDINLCFNGYERGAARNLLVSLVARYIKQTSSSLVFVLLLLIEAQTDLILGKCSH